MARRHSKKTIIVTNLKATEELANLAPISDHMEWESEMKYHLAILNLVKHKIFSAFIKKTAKILKGKSNINDMRDHCRQNTSDYKNLKNAELDKCLQYLNSLMPLDENITEDQLKTLINDMPIFDDFVEKLRR